MARALPAGAGDPLHRGEPRPGREAAAEGQDAEPAEAARVEKAVADDIADRKGAERVRSTAEVGKDLAARIAG